MENITTTSAHDLVEKIKKGEISSVEICEAYLERIKKFEKDVKAWAFFDKKLLMEKAKEKDEYRKSGKPLGALHGLPVAVKDIVGTVDMPTECGTVIRKGKSYSQNAEIIDLLKYDGENVIKEFLSILDDLDRLKDALASSSNSSDSKINEGIDLIINKINKQFKELGVVQFTEIGDVVDPELHDALMMRTEEGKEENTVLEVFEKGYRYKDRVIRHAKVVVNQTAS